MTDYIEKRAYLSKVFEKIPIYVVKDLDLNSLGGFVKVQQDLFMN